MTQKEVGAGVLQEGRLRGPLVVWGSQASGGPQDRRSLEGRWGLLQGPHDTPTRREAELTERSCFFTSKFVLAFFNTSRVLES